MTTVQTGKLGLPAPAATFARNLFYSGKGYGLEMYDPGAWPGGDHTSTVAYSKTGGAGTLLVIDPDPARDLMFILLTNHGLPSFAQRLGVDVARELAQHGAELPGRLRFERRPGPGRHRHHHAGGAVVTAANATFAVSSGGSP